MIRQLFFRYLVFLKYFRHTISKHAHKNRLMSQYCPQIIGVEITTSKQCNPSPRN